MNGARAIAVSILIFASGFRGIASVAAKDAVLKGHVTLDGNDPGFSLPLQVMHDGKPVTMVVVDERGNFSATIPLPGQTPIVVLPYNEMALQADGKSFLSGAGHVALLDAAVLNIALTTMNVISRAVRVVDAAGAPVCNVPIGCSASIPMSGGTESPTRWTRQWQAATNSSGVLSLRILDADEGIYELSLNAQGLDGDRYVGSLSLSGVNIRKAKESPLLWKVARKRLSLDVQCIWDPDFSDQPFRPGVGADMSRHTVILNNDGATETLMDGNGRIRFYDLKPGKYSISFKRGIDALYRISRATGEVDVPAGQRGPVKHTVALMPIKREVWKLRGVVRDSQTTKPVSGVLVHNVRGATRSGDDGTFSLDVLSSSALIVEHGEYHQLTMSLPEEIASKPDVMSISIDPYPSLSGTVRAGEQGVAALAQLEFLGAGRDFGARCGKDGRFQLRLQAGRYRLRIKAPILPPGDELARWPLPTAVLVDEIFEMPDRDLRRDFRTALSGKTIIHVEWVPETPTTPPPAAICLLRKSDGLVMATAQTDRNTPTVLYAPEGEYTILAVADDRHGVLCEPITVTSKKETTKRVQIRQWNAMRFNDNGIPEFPARSEGGENVPRN